MSYGQFGLGMLIAILVSVAGAVGIYFAFDVAYATPIIIGMGILLALICGLMFWLGKLTAGSENKFLFGNIFMGMTGVKMLACAGILFAYITLTNPPNSLFVLPVFFVYLVFTTLEVIALVMLSREAK